MLEEKVSEELESTESTNEEAVEQPATNQEVEAPVFDLDGEKVTAEQIKEWKQGYLRQDDYTRKSQEVAEMRKELEALRQESQKEDFTGYTQEQQDAIKFLREEVERATQERTRPLQSELRQIKEDTIIDREISTLSDKYELSKKDIDNVLIYAGKLGMPIKYGNLENAYKLMTWDDQRKKGEEKAKESLQEKKSAFSMKTSTSSSGYQPKGRRKSFDETIADLKENI